MGIAVIVMYCDYILTFAYMLGIHTTIRQSDTFARLSRPRPTSH